MAPQQLDAGLTKIILYCLIIVCHQSRSAAKGTRANQPTRPSIYKRQTSAIEKSPKTMALFLTSDNLSITHRQCADPQGLKA